MKDALIQAVNGRPAAAVLSGGSESSLVAPPPPTVIGLLRSLPGGNEVDEYFCFLLLSSASFGSFCVAVIVVFNQFTC